MMVSDVYPPLIGGQEAEVQILCEGLKNKGHDIVVCTINHDLLPFVAKENGVKVYRTKGVFQRIPKLYHNPERKFHPPTKDWLLAGTLRDIIRSERPDIIHSHGWMLYSILGTEEASKIPLCVTFHDYGFTCPHRSSSLFQGGICESPLSSLSECLSCGRNDSGLAKSFFSFCFLKLHRAFTCDALVLTNLYLFKQMNYLKIPKIFLEHPIKTDEYRPIDTKEYKDRILIWAKLERIKGIDTVFHVAKLLSEYKFDVIFSGDDRAYYKSIKPPNVRLLPRIPPSERPEFINRYPLIVGQFLMGAFGHSELEVMSCGKPVIAYWNREYDSFYDTPCPILSSKETKEIAELIRTNVGNNNIGRSNRQWIINTHSAEKVTAKLERIYECVVEGRRVFSANFGFS